jgi:hypothetical protein
MPYSLVGIFEFRVVIGIVPPIVDLALPQIEADEL